MSEERKPVMCPCGNEMHFGCTERAAMCGEAPWAGMYICRCGWSSPYREGDTPIDCERNACLAATRRPPNLPLTKEQIMGMDDLDAVWLSFADAEETKNTLALAGAFDWKIKLRYAALPVDPMFFSVRPTPADIEAARKECTE